MRKLALQGRLDRRLSALQLTQIAGTARRGFSTTSTTRLRMTSSALMGCRGALQLLRLELRWLLVHMRAAHHHLSGHRDLERRPKKLLCPVARKSTKHTRSYLALQGRQDRRLPLLRSTRIAGTARQGYGTISTRRPRRTSSGLTACREALRFPQPKRRQLLLRVRAARGHPVRWQVDLEPRALCRVASKSTKHSMRKLALQGRLDRPLPLLRSTRIAGTARQGFSTTSTTRLRMTSSGLMGCRGALRFLHLKLRWLLVHMRAAHHHLSGHRDLERRPKKLLCLVARKSTKHTRSYLALQGRQGRQDRRLPLLRSTRIAGTARQGYGTTSTKRPRRTSSGLTACREVLRFPQPKR